MATLAPTPWNRNPKIVDLMDYNNFLDGPPLDKFAVLRRDYPVYWNEEADPEPGFWNLTRYEDIVEVSKDNETFSSAKGINIFYFPEFDPAILGALVGNMITLDPPLHTAYRGIAAPFFTVRAVAKLKERIRGLTEEILDSVAGRGECEFMSEIAAKLPIAVLCHIMGVPESDRAKIFEWSNQLVGLEDPDLNPSMEAAFGTFMELFAYGRDLAAARRANPRDDLMTAMVQAKPNDMPVPDALMDGFFLLMVIAGNETTRNTISGGMRALIEHPDQRRKLLERPELMPTAVEEILRWVSAVMHMRRTATRDTEIRGVPIREGDKVVMWYGAANRDESVFKDPDSFDVAREPNPHLAFGIGRHRCLGSTLAQLQLQEMFTALLRRFPDMELAGEVTHVRTNFINGIKSMPVTFTPSA